MPKKIITTPSNLAVDETFDDPRFMKVRIDVYESDVEARGHGFYFSRKSLENGKDSIANIPVLANVVSKEDKDGNEILDYGSHDFHEEPDKFKDGENRIIYDEKIVGIVPESCNLTIEDNEQGHAVLSVDAFLMRDYGGYVCDILESRDGKTSVSAEVDIGDTVFNKDRNLEEASTCFTFGITLLGADVEPAIASANATMLSADEKDRTEQLSRIMQELKESLDNHTKAVLSAENERKEAARMNHFEELLAKYNLSADQITFDHENMSNEELDAAFEKLAKNSSEPSPQPTTEPTPANTVELSAKIGETEFKLSRSLDEVIYSLTSLVNNTYSSADDDYYGVEVFDDGTAKSKYVIMSGYYNGKAYKQSWGVKDGEYTLKGDREEVFSEWLTASERDQLEKVRSGYASLSSEVDKYKQELAKYEAEPDKIAILQKEEYDMISDTKEYTELLNSHFDVTKEDLSSKLDTLLLNYVKEHSKKNNKENLSVDKKPSAGCKLFPNSSGGQSGRYGGIFSK